MRFRARKTFEREVRAEPEFKAHMVATTREVAAVIRFMALPYRHTGYYIQHIEERGTRVLFLDPFYHLSEYGSIHNPPQRNALRGVKAAGLRFEDDGAKQAESP